MGQGQGMSDDKPVTRPQRYIGNILLPVAVLVVAAVFLSQTFGFPGGNGDVGPAGVPYLWIAFLAIFSVGLIFQAVAHRMAPDPVPGRVGFVLLYVGGLCLYLVAIKWLGYYASTFIFLVASMYLLGARSHLVIVLVAVGWLVFSYFVFADTLHIDLPDGWLMQRLSG